MKTDNRSIFEQAEHWKLCLGVAHSTPITRPLTYSGDIAGLQSFLKRLTYWVENVTIAKS